MLRTPLCEVNQPRRVFIADDFFNLISLSDIKNRQLSVVISTCEKEYGGIWSFLLYIHFTSICICEGLIWLYAKLAGAVQVTRIKLGEHFASKIPSLKMSLVCFRVDGESGKAERGASALQLVRDAFKLLQGCVPWLLCGPLV